MANPLLFLLTGITIEKLQVVKGTVHGRGICWEYVREKKKNYFTGDNYMIDCHLLPFIVCYIVFSFKFLFQLQLLSSMIQKEHDRNESVYPKITPNKKVLLSTFYTEENWEYKNLESQNNTGGRSRKWMLTLGQPAVSWLWNHPTLLLTHLNTRKGQRSVKSS